MTQASALTMQCRRCIQDAIGECVQCQCAYCGRHGLPQKERCVNCLDRNIRLFMRVGVACLVMAIAGMGFWCNDAGWGFACASVPFLLVALADLALLYLSGAIGFYWRDRSVE